MAKCNNLTPLPFKGLTNYRSRIGKVVEGQEMVLAVL